MNKHGTIKRGRNQECLEKKHKSKSTKVTQVPEAGGMYTREKESTT